MELEEWFPHPPAINHHQTWELWDLRIHQNSWRSWSSTVASHKSICTIRCQQQNFMVWERTHLNLESDPVMPSPKFLQKFLLWLSPAWTTPAFNYSFLSERKNQQTEFLGHTENFSLKMPRFSELHQMVPAEGEIHRNSFPNVCSPFIFVHRQLKGKETHFCLNVKASSLEHLLGVPEAQVWVFQGRGNWVRVLHLTDWMSQLL